MTRDATRVRASVVIPAHNAERTIQKTLDALDRQTFKDFEVVVVDDGSTDSTAAIVKQSGARLVRNPDPAGPGAARNAGAAVAKGEALAFTDADCIPTPNWLSAGLDALGHAAIAQGRVLPEPGVLVGPFDRTLWVTGPVGLFETANLFVDRTVFEQLEGFGDGLLALAGAHFGEDVIFGWRARRAGIATDFCDAALVHHAVFARGPAAYLRERKRVAYFCEIARRVPELRDSFFFRRWFLSRRTAKFTFAVAGALIATATRRPVFAVSAAPYARALNDDRRAFGVRASTVIAAADALTLAALVRGSLRFRSPVL